MLKQNHIPEKEPVVSIGIVMPEDGADELEILVPDLLSEDYLINYDEESSQLKPGSSLSLKILDNKVHLHIDGEEVCLGDEIGIQPVEQKKALAPQSGIIVKDVISGRDFHWKKHLDVYLTDTIRVRIVDNSLFLFNELPLEHYLMCVATSEMNAECPDAFVEAQTIVARSWMLAAAEQKHKNLGLDACNDDCCQRYQGTSFLSSQSIKGSLNTSGIVAVYNNQICDTRYSKSCGGVMETFDTIWEDIPVPYLKNIPDAAEKPGELLSPLSDENNFNEWVNAIPDTYCSSKSLDEQELKKYLGTVDEKGEYFRWDKIISQQEITDNINDLHKIKASAIIDLKAIKRGSGGRIITLQVGYLDKEGERKKLLLNKDFVIRQSMDKSFLYSSAFIVTKENGDSGIPSGFKFKGAGWGHGVGFCQIGALSMALLGHSADKIITHYFPGAELKTIYQDD